MWSSTSRDFFDFFYVEDYLILSSVVFLVSVFGITVFRRDVVRVLIAFEFIILAISLIFISFSINLDDFTGQIFAVFILAVGAAESAIGLAILVKHYRVAQHIIIDYMDSVGL